MKKWIAAFIVLLLMAISPIVTAQIIPPLTLTKKRIVIQNIEKCGGERTTLVGRGEFDPEKQKHPKYVCRTRHVTVEIPPRHPTQAEESE